MKRSLIIGILALLAVGCTNSASYKVEDQVESTPATNAERPQTMAAHTTENETPVPANSAPQTSGSSKWTQSGNPIDTAKFDGVIKGAESAVETKPNDVELKKTLSEAYFDRGYALTEARQYASALGDYRRALKYDPDNADAKKWIDQIISIYGMLKKEYPPEGQEPPPLPFKKESPL